MPDNWATMIGIPAQAHAPIARRCRSSRILSRLTTTFHKNTSAIDAMRILTACPNRHCTTVSSHFPHVEREGGPKELRTKPRAPSANTTALRNSEPPNDSDRSSENARFQQRRDARNAAAFAEIQIRAKTKTGGPIVKNDAFDQYPRPIASPRPIQFLGRSDGSLQWTKR